MSFTNIVCPICDFAHRIPHTFIRKATLLNEHTFDCEGHYWCIILRTDVGIQLMAERFSWSDRHMFITRRFLPDNNPYSIMGRPIDQRYNYTVICFGPNLIRLDYIWDFNPKDRASVIESIERMMLLQ